MYRDLELSRETPSLRHIQDLSSRVWVLHNDILIAVPRKEQTVPVAVTLLPCQYLETLEKDRGEPVYLGLDKPERCLFCTKEGEQPVLQLKEGDIMELYRQKEPVKASIFYHNKSGTTSTFESAAFPGWFIAACSKGSCPLFLTQELGETHITDFEKNIVSTNSLGSSSYVTQMLYMYLKATVDDLKQPYGAPSTDEMLLPRQCPFALTVTAAATRRSHSCCCHHSSPSQSTVLQ
ncbi:hypothetical protein STEG23_014740 [Scotinomys teguina]